MHNSPIKTEFTRQFGIKNPIICAPMFLVSTEKLVVAVSENGAMGTFPALNYRPIEKYREAIRNIKSQTSNPFGINIIVQKSNKWQHSQVEIALEEKVPLLITSLGNPKEVIRQAHQIGTKVYCDVVGIEHAKKVTDLGADGIIAVSSGAGGHAGTISPFVLIPILVRNIQLPVVAAGNIVDGAGMAAAFSLGASAVYVGTRFIASTEAEVSQNFKSAILKAQAEDIINTAKVDGFPGNFIRTSTLEKVGLKTGIFEDIFSRSKKVKRWLALSRAARSLLASNKSRVSYKNVFSAGQGAGLIEDVLPVGEIIEKIINEYRKIIAGFPE